MKPKSTAYSMSILLLLGTACGQVDLPDQGGGVDDRPVTRAANAPPILGGTLLVTRDGTHAVLADPARDSVHIVDLVAWKETATLELESGALPFRAAEDADGNVHVTLRGTGEVLTVDPASATTVRTTSVCPNPRGIAYDEAAQGLHVACAGGLFVTLPDSGQAPARRKVTADLRDVFVSEGRVFVTRFRAAEVIEVEADGGWSVVGAPESLVEHTVSREPTTAWRTLARPDGGWLMLHQSASTDPVPPFVEPLDNGPDDPSGGGYAGTDQCSAVVNTTLSAMGDDGVVRNAGLFGSIALAVDAAISPDGLRVAFATPTQGDTGNDEVAVSVLELRIDTFSTDTDVGCETPQVAALNLSDDVVAVAYQPDGALLAQARDEPILYRLTDGGRQELVLTGADAADTGFALFHNDAGQGISCASCHPEGGQDGRTWVFDEVGPRRTQALDVGLEGTAPFHWAGDMTDMQMIARQVRQSAMGGDNISEEQQHALRDWIFALRPPNPMRPATEADVATGQQLFASLACASCHAGASFTSPASADLGLGLLQTPALRGVAFRAPYMHDARASTLEEAVVDMVSTTVPGTVLKAEEVSALVAYLESL